METKIEVKIKPYQTIRTLTNPQINPLSPILTLKVKGVVHIIIQIEEVLEIVEIEEVVDKDSVELELIIYIIRSVPNPT